MALNDCDDDQFSLEANHASSEETVVLYIDKFRVEQILRNLVSNAIKFTPNSGTITIRFTIISASSATAAASPIAAAVGSPPLILLLDQPILKLQDDSVEKQIRSYLRIEHFHSGGEGQGSTFYVDLPVFKRNRSDPAVEVPLVDSAAVDLNDDSPSAIRHSISFTSSAAAPTAPTDADDSNIAAAAATADIEMGVKGLRVLVVDDSSANRKIVRRMLERQDNTAVLRECIVIEADDGVTGLEALQTELAAGRAVNLVLMDYVMINMNGPEAVQKMRTEVGYTGPVIGITGNALPEDIAFFKAHGANNVITKPLTNAKLLDAIELHRQS